MWVVEAILDIPVQFPSTITTLVVNLGSEDPDGFVQLRPMDQERATKSVFWTASQPISYECRAMVRASSEFYALLRGTELYEHVADRLTLLFGYPIRALSVGFVYNEDDLKLCIAGTAAEFRATTGGEPAFKTQLPKNSSEQLMRPPPTALEAIRWFRHALIAARRIDQYLYYYIALESIAKHVPGVTRQPRPDKPSELETQESAAIRYLLGRRSIPPDGRRTLAKIRARIAHGSTDAETLELASSNLRLLQKITADGIALVYGVEPDSLNVLPPTPVEFIAPIGRATFGPNDNPAAKWGGLLSDQFAEYLSKAKQIRNT